MAPSTSSSSSSSSTTSVQVALRIRPPTAQDAVSIPARFQRTVIHASSPTQVQVDPVNAVPSSSGSTSSTSSPSSASASAATNKKQLFSFDHVLPPEATQHGLFTQTAQPLLQRFLDGFNCTILAYGQTSSGKTFTMTGQDLDADPDDPHNSMGIIPRAVSSIFNRARALKNERGPAWSFSVKASFIEIYNEDLIDLLSDGGHSEVQIRENKDGSIIWGGLREVAVNSPAEVMQLLRQGTSIRRTNETDMNAQSSRSHAIFSLTLTQRKFTGSGSPGRAPSPLPGGRSPSRLARPGSMFSTPPRVTSPTQGRPSTPSGGGSFASAMARGGGHQRPASSLGHHLDTPRKDGAANGGGGGGGEWITVVSKFHFVDLAGSERLKRTAAAGERIKEGISINSGLLALGNVISALGDPARAKSHTATYVPYRDSKLTRLLQDSLGGNAHTLMIACVSAAEWNAAETVNTLKYANRARNIKNRATINEREEGWDDVEWLQATVTRLRKEVKAIKEGGPVPPAGASEHQHSDGPGGAASKKLLQSLDELKANYEDLREKYVARNEELTRLRKEHGEHARSATTGTVGGMSKYEEIVGPVIEEYEKSISSLEAELALNRAALRHTNELVEEKEEELNALTERKEATELYVDELRSRLAKITEREALTEAYVRDLEEKLKQYDDSSASSTDSMNDLRRELARYKDTEARSTMYISDLESRLAKADESVLALRQTVERLEHESDRRRTEIVSLQGRLEDFKRDGEGWRSDLEAREARVKDLEAKMEEWEKARKEAQAERERLGAIASAAADAEKTHASAAASSVSLVTTSSTDGSGEPAPIETELVTLRQTHTATLADLDAVSAKYRDALREISDLAAQINELRLSGAAAPPAPIAESPERASVELPALSPPMSAGGSGRRRVGREGSLSANGHPGSRRLFFRHAASAESLHSRSLSQSQSLSQELSSAHSRKTSFSSHSSHSSIGGSPNGHKPSLSITLPALQVSPHERSAQSLEKEIMRLQEVLRERETEIGVLERELKVQQQQQGLRTANGEETPATMTTATTSARSDSGSATPQTPATSTPSPTMDGRAPDLSPGTVFRFEKIRNGLQSAIENGNGHAHHDSVSTVDHDEQLERLNELMRAMAQKESQHREVVDGLQIQLTQLRRQHDELTALSSNQAHNMSAELAALRKGHDADLARLEDVVAREKDVRVMLDAAQAEHAAARETHDHAIARLREEHAEAVRARAEEVDKLVERIRAEHAQELERALAQVTELEKAHGALRVAHDARADELVEVQRERDEHVATLKAKEDEAAKTEEEYYNALTRLRTEHADALARQAEAHASLVSRLQDEHAAAVRVLEIAREGSANESEGAQAQAMRGLQDEHAAALARREAAFAEDIARAREEHLRALSALADEHGASTEKIRAEHAAQLAKAEERLAMAERQHEAARAEADSALAAVKEQHASVMDQIAAAHEDEVAKLVLQHATALEAATTQARAERDALARRHTEELAALRAEHDEAIKRAIEQAQGEHAALQQSHSDRSLAALREHEAAVQEERARAEAERDRLVQEHAAARAAHEKALAELHAILATEQEGHRDALDSVKRVEEALAVEKDQLSAAAAALQTERDTLSRDRDELRNELKSYQAAVDKHTLAREQDQLRLAQDAETIQNLHQDLSDAHNEREELAQQVAALRAELATTTDRQTTIVQEASKRESLVQELEKHRSVLAETQRTLQRVKDEKDAMQEEKLRQEFAMRDLQAQLARVPSPSQDHIPTPASPSLHSRPGTERTMSTFSRSKLPPPTPPPSVPPPPAPAPSAPLPRVAEHHAHSSVASSTPPVSTTSSRDSEMITVDSPATSVMQHPPAPDPKLIAQVEEQARAIEEQEAMIKTLNKQLTHCESDLQAHMDLVTTLETSLGDSEKNLRKVRMQATELARERDTLNQLIDSLRGELAEAKREVVTVRRSVVEEKQSLEHRLDEERRAKEKARQQLDVRMEELQKRKSKFVCL